MPTYFIYPTLFPLSPNATNHNFVKRNNRKCCYGTPPPPQPSSSIRLSALTPITKRPRGCPLDINGKGPPSWFGQIRPATRRGLTFSVSQFSVRICCQHGISVLRHLLQYFVLFIALECPPNDRNVARGRSVRAAASATRF